MVVGDDPGLLFNMVTGETAVAFDDEGNATPGSMRLIGNYAALPSFVGAYIYTPASSTLVPSWGLDQTPVCLRLVSRSTETWTLACQPSPIPRSATTRT